MTEAPEIPNAALLAARVADAKLGQRTVVLAMADLLALADAFVITSGSNPRQVRAIVEEIERRLKEADGTAPLRVEGLDDARWVLMDYADFLVHVFMEEAREYYDLEHLWGGAPRVEWDVATDGHRSSGSASTPDIQVVGGT